MYYIQAIFSLFKISRPINSSIHCHAHIGTTSIPFASRSMCWEYWGKSRVGSSQFSVCKINLWEDFPGWNEQYISYPPQIAEPVRSFITNLKELPSWCKKRRIEAFNYWFFCNKWQTCSSSEMALYNIYLNLAPHFIHCSHGFSSNLVQNPHLFDTENSLPISITDPWWWKTFTAECSSRQKGHLLYFPEKQQNQRCE